MPITQSIALLLLLARDGGAFSPPSSFATSKSSITRETSQASNYAAVSNSCRSRTCMFNLGRNYLDTINEDESNQNRNSGTSGNRWSYGYGQGNKAASGAGTAIRPPQQGTSRQGDRGFGIGGGGNAQQGTAKIVPIKQPQDLLDFVIEDERLSVVKVYASWCKTCQVFDIRYRKLASQIGDRYSPNNQLLEKGRVRFSEMQFDDPNNEEMCRLLNATKLPYILMYKGSRGKIIDFQCGPSNFQSLIDAVNDHADPASDGGMVVAPVLEEVEEEQEWRVMQEQQQEEEKSKAKADGMIKQKDQEITRLYKELSNLRKDYDQKIQTLKEEHNYETGELREKMEMQTKQYEEERSRLSAQIKQLTQDMIEREKAYRSGDDSTSSQLRRDLKNKEKQYETTLNGLEYKIASLEEDLFKTKNELKYNAEASEREKEEMAATIALLEEEQANLLSKNKELQKELVQDKQLVVQTTQEASRVLQQLETMRVGKEEEAAKLMARIQELEEEIARIHADNNGGYDMSQAMERLKEEYEKERELMAARIIELESNQGEWRPGGSMELQQERERVMELEESLASVKGELAQRDRLLRTSNKATDILLDQMEAQKRSFEKELERTAELTNELEEAIAKRELELRELQAQFSSLERMAEGLKARDMRRVREEMTGTHGGAEDERWQMERELRLSAEQEVNKLRELMNQRGGEEFQSWGENKPKKSFFEQMFGPRGNNGGSWDGSFGDGLGFGRSQESMREVPVTRSKEPKDAYDLLNDVLAPDEVSPREFSPSWFGAGNSNSQEAGFYTPSPSAVNEAPVRVPTPQQEFERRLAENPIVPAGAFGGSRPTAQFFRPSTPSTMESSPSDPLPPAASYAPRPTSPTPRVQARPGISDNIYAGAGTAASDNVYAGAGSSSRFAPPSPSVPSPSVYEEQAQVPTPQLEFERRIAENPIVPSGAFGGSKPTANFFRKATAPSPPPRQFDSGGRNQDDTQSKWANLDEAEKKRVAAEAYKAFEQQLKDRRGQETPKQGLGGGGGLGGVGRSPENSPRSTLQNERTGSVARGPPAGNPARSTIMNQKEDQLLLERKKHQEMVSQAARERQQQDGESTQHARDNKSPIGSQEKVQRAEDPVNIGRNQTAQEMRRSAAEASTKRSKKAEDASMELKRQNQMKAEAIKREQSERRSREEAILQQRQEEEKRRNAMEEKAQAVRVKAEREAAEKQKLLDDLKSKKISDAKAKAEQQKLLMENQRRIVAEAKERERQMQKLEADARAKVEDEGRARVEKQTQQAMTEQLEADARARAIEEKIQLEEKKMAKAGAPKNVNIASTSRVPQNTRPAEGFQKTAQPRAAQKPQVQQPGPGKSLRDLAVSGKQRRVPAGTVTAGNDAAKYKVVVLKEGSKSELEGPLKDLLGSPKEGTATRKNDNY